MHTPVIIEASSLHRKQAALPRSSGVEKRPIGIVARNLARISGVSWPMKLFSSITVSSGQSVTADAAFATILPAGSKLQVELLVPTRAIGFVTKGKEVALRYEAFPYERFGQYRGVIADVSQTVWSPGDKVGPLVVREPAYRITAKLDRQTVEAMGQEIPLRSGMLVNADILLEKRSLLEWIFEPVLQLRGRL